MKTWKILLAAMLTVAMICVFAACAKEVMKQDKASAMANNSSFVWDKLNSKGKHQNGDVEDLLARSGIRK